MSANDPLPWIEPICKLIGKAVGAGIPVIGHCLGGQLMSKALGGYVIRNPVKEIGWGEVWPAAGGAIKRWLGELAGENIPVFHWHGETFSLPPDSARLLESAWCANQAFAYGPHLGMQCHVEMLPEMIRNWCKGWDEEVRDLGTLPPSVQTPEAMQ
ncbi:MAG: type 1 glutamine amidotransferase, partial [Betaproteobacteria bacterium]